MNSDRLRRLDILTRYARVNGGGLVRCTPSPKSTDRRSEGKFIFDSEADAVAAATALELIGGSKPQDFYVCHRSTRRQHMHLTTRKGLWRTPRLLNERTVEGKV